MNSIVIEARNLSKRYGTHQALNNTSLQVKRGQILGLIGPNGAGKTTLLKAILGLSTVEGDLEVLGKNPKKQRTELLNDVCFIADTATLPRWMKVKDVLTYVEGVHQNFDRAKANTLLSNTDIQIDSKVSQLSKGMTTQLHLAIVMAVNAKILILDEPTLGLDILYRKQFYNTLLSDYYDEDKTIVITTHQVEEIESILTDVAFIQKGEIVLDDSMQHLAENYQQIFVKPQDEALARSFHPIHMQKTFGGFIAIYQHTNPEALQSIGDSTPPSLADLFVALMGDNT